MKHTTDARILGGAVNVALVGAGGNGSQMLTGLGRLDRAIRACGHPGGLDVTLFDPEKVSEANVGRQLFSPSDIGLYKAVVLVQRVNLFFGLDWSASPERFIGQYKESILGSGHGYTSGTPWSILITCVDSAKSRRLIYQDSSTGRGIDPVYWLDLGNRQHDGQAVLGQFSGPRTWQGSSRDLKNGLPAPPPRLPHVVDIFPELLDETIPEDNRPSCSLAESLDQQDLFVNQAVTTWGLNLLWKLFRDGGIDHHGYFVNLASGRVNPIDVPGEDHRPGTMDRRRKAGRRAERIAA